MVAKRRGGLVDLVVVMIVACMAAAIQPARTAAAETTTSKGDRLTVPAEPAENTDEQPETGSEPPAASETETAAAKGALPPIHYGTDKLPERVLNTRNALLHAASTGDIENLRAVLEQNEMMPMVSFGGASDPIAYWKEISADGTGRDILAEIIKVLTSGYVRVEPGTEREMFIWPYHYLYPIDRLTPSQEVELYLLISPQERKNMNRAGAYLGYRAAIGPDGTLHFFIAGD